MSKQQMIILLSFGVISLAMIFLAIKSVSAIARFSLASVSEAGIDVPEPAPRNGAPAKVMKVKAESEDCNIYLSWSSIPGVKSYRIYRGGTVGSEVIIGGSEDNYFVDSDLNCKQKASYRVSAINNRGEGIKSSSVKVLAK